MGREDGGETVVLHRPVAHSFQIHNYASGGFVAGSVGNLDVVLYQRRVAFNRLLYTLGFQTDILLGDSCAAVL